MSLIEEHFEEIQLLWEFRLKAICDPDYFSHDLKELDERIAAHIDGLVVSSDAAEPLIAEGLQASERCVVFAAAYAALKIDSPKLLTCLFASLDATEAADAQDGFADAFCMCQHELACEELKKKIMEGSPGAASVAAQSLAFHGILEENCSRLAEFIVDDDANVRRRGWDIVSSIGR